MTGRDLLGALLLLVSLVGILSFMLRGMRPARRPGRTRPRLADYGERGVFVPGFVSVLALVTFADVVGVPGTGTQALAAVLAVACVAIGRVPVLVTQVCGGLGTLAAGIDFVRTVGCTGDDVVFTTAVLVLAVVLCAMAAGASSLLVGRLFSMDLLAAFGALEVLAFLAQPLGVPILETVSPGGATILLIVAAVLFGSLVGVAPGLAVALGGLAGGFAAVYAEAAWGTMCGPADSGTLVALVVFVVVCGLGGFVRSLVRR
ncbi:hypothetical protein [Xylanimonas protaetiae]|uniref:Uncharacterized protein n=1 Tax=Xylanimonas protaetiae TaxID=2509457 RepID=A0A4P6F7L0_9MICO|nr:hypothetical protein [Xylanimonas protaetiae]QAY71436.1 hypothetical protein ET471_16525 [Xylanimonas protaetiae]